MVAAVGEWHHLTKTDSGVLSTNFATVAGGCAGDVGG